MRGRRVPSICEDAISGVALSIREAFRITDEYLPIVHLLDVAVPKVMDDFQLRVLPNNLMANDHGRAWPNDYLIEIREDVYEGARRGCVGDRVTLAHEFGHFVLHREVPLFSQHKLNTVISEENSEWQADCLARELLAPRTLIDLGDKVETVILKFGIPREEAKRQIRASQRISR